MASGSIGARRQAVGPGQVGLKGWLVGSLGNDRTYKAEDRALTINFVLAKENGEWRINTPPRRTAGCRVFL